MPRCAEGAIELVNGKARLVADRLCDGLGNCLGSCPRGAITIEERPADEFDPHAVERHLNAAKVAAQPAATRHPEMPCGCPGAAARKLSAGRSAGPKAATTPAPVASTAAGESRLGHWPVQLALLPVNGSMWQDADVLIAADCVPVAMAGFHEALLAGRTVAIACPKLDDPGEIVEKLAAIFAGNAIRSITVARMEVPCCRVPQLVAMALGKAGRDDLDVREVTIGLDGQVQSDFSGLH